MTALRVDEHDGVLTLTLDRPHRRNALDGQTLAHLHHELDRVASRTDVRVVVLTGAGGAFSSGADLKSRREDLVETHGVPAAELALRATLSPTTVLASQELMAGAFEKLHRLRQPVIAAIDGPALGGGFALALACDIRFATPAATFGAIFIRHGVSACDMGTSYHLPRLVGAGRAAELMLTGRVFDAAEAERIGLLTSVVSETELLGTARRTAEQIAQHSPLAVWMTKETFWQNVDAPSLRHALDLENRTQVMCVASGDLDRSFAAFRDGATAVPQPL